MKLRKSLVLILGAIAMEVVACSKITGDSNSNSFGSYDQTTMLTNIGSNILLPDIVNFSVSASAEYTAVTAFSDNPSTQTLAAAQTAFADLAMKWAVVAPFNFGPLSDNSLSSLIDTWPVKSAKIEAAISAHTNASAAGADAKGLKALEYLLFDANGNTAVLSKYQGVAASDRLSYLVAVSQGLKAQANALQNLWSSSNGDFVGVFEGSKGNDVSSSLSRLINSMSLYLDEVKNMKIGNPIGMGVTINDNLAHPDMIEYTLTESSLAVMKANTQAMKTAFDGGTGQGLDDLLNYVKAKKDNQNLSTVVNNQFDDVIAKINAITPPYATALGSQTVQLQAVYNSLKALIVLFKVDIANNLGVTITFADTDGD